MVEGWQERRELSIPGHLSWDGAGQSKPSGATSEGGPLVERDAVGIPNEPEARPATGRRTR
jgi:hypothetical protein